MAVTVRPVVHFGSFTGGIKPGQYEDVTGTFQLDGKEIALKFGILEQATGEKTTDVYRRHLVKVRDALSDIIANPDGIRV